MTDFATHARTLPAALTDLTRDLVKEIHRETHEFVRAEAEQRTPVRTGKMRSAWQDVPAGASSAIDRLQPTKIRNAAPQAVVIDQGRRKSRNAWKVRRGKGYIVKPGKMLGSEQAPRGIKGPVLRELAGQEDAIFDRAAAKVERKGR
ncbi:MAG TPA: hypothetical protein VD948_10955 [Rhodothermales bacterium]|nr:hypothetical protein [Rhodothermales bacterium]